MSNSVVRGVWVLIALSVIAGDARAERLALSHVRAEADLQDEAGAIALLLRSAIETDDRSVVPISDQLTVSEIAPQLTKLGADRAVLLDLAREGTGLRLSVVVVDGGGVHASLIRAGDGELQSLAQGIADQITSGSSTERRTVRDLGLAHLRPLSTALRLRTSDPIAAARALAEADPMTAFTLPGAKKALLGLSGEVADPVASTLAARALDEADQLDKLAAGTGPVATAARALAAISRSNFTGVDEALQAGPPRDGLITLARVAMAAVRSDNKILGERVLAGLAGDQRVGVLAIVSLLTPGRLPAPIQRHVLDLLNKSDIVSAGTASRIGLASALTNVEPERGLALVSVREHQVSEIDQIARLVQTGSDPTRLRLRAELAMRRSLPSEAETIAAFVASAPTDVRAQRYQGWLLMSTSRFVDAAAAFARAGAPTERIRALLAARDLDGAMAAMGHEPRSAVELEIAARVALREQRFAEASRFIAIAEHIAPISPGVHAVVIALAGHGADPSRVAVSKAIVEAGSVPISLPGADATRPKDVAIGSAQGSGEGELATTVAVAMDTAPVRELLEALPDLKQLADRRLVVGELAWDRPWYVLRSVDSKGLRDALVQVLSQPPYRLQVTIAAPIEALEQGALARLTETAPIALLFRITADGKNPRVTLTLYHRGASAGEQAPGRTLPIPGVISWDRDKLLPLGVLGLIALLGGGLWLSRFMSRIRIEIERAPDVSDEVLCVEITKSPIRPVIGDPDAFHAATKKAGTRSKARSATLVASGETFNVSSGRWYVHLYGTYLRGNQLRSVPETCTEAVTLRLGEKHEVRFALTSKLSEVTLIMESEPRRGVAVWPNDSVRERVFTDATGEVSFQLPLGTHTLHIEAAGHTFNRVVQVISPKLMRVGFNMTRELRLGQAIQIDHDEVVHAELELGPGEGSRRMEGNIAGEPLASVPAPPVVVFATARTQAVVGAVTGPPIYARAQTPVPGDLLLGRYKIIAELGRGAMGVVHRALDEKLEREVAIKEMAESLHANPEAMRLFTQEAKALAQLNHTNIVAMYDQITESGKVYLIMEFVDGQPLASILEASGKFPWRDAVAIVDQVCAGLAYAHARRVIHRDIKPANIFVGKDRTAKLGDFGLARVMREVSNQRTEIRGTPLYMAPEQITGLDVDHRADLYAVGCMLFELVCGRPPFIDGDILYAQMHSPPPSPREFCPPLPEPLDQLILALMAKSSDDRPGSANEVRAALKSL